MSRFLFLFNLLVWTMQPLIGQTILRHFEPANATYPYPTVYKQYVSRFDLNQSIQLESIRIKCSGPAGASAQVTLLGHEAGTSFPQVEQPIIAPIAAIKQTGEDEWITVKIPRVIEFSGNQFFVVIQDLSGGFKLYADVATREAGCSSSNGGDFYYAWLKTSSDQWTIATRKSFAVEVVGQSSSIPKPYFEEKTVEMGLDPNLSNASMAVADINNDHYPDILVAGRLFMNQNGKTFEQDTTSYSSPGAARANALVDIDNDGDLDIILLDVGATSYIAENTGNGFTNHEVTLPDLNSINSASFADLNKDGFPDLFVSQLWGTYPVPKPNYLFRNNGDFTFTDITTSIYPNHQGEFNYSNNTACDPDQPATWTPNQNKNRRSRGSRFVDFDQDGDLDLYVVNYFLEQDELYVNDGTGNFSDVCAAKNIDRNQTGSNHGTGVDWADFDADGDMDLLLAQFAHPAYAKQYDHRATTVYVNDKGNFTDLNAANQLVDAPSGIEFEETYAGAAWGDFNNDGYDDFLNTVYYGCRYVKMFQNKGDRTFSNVTHSAGFSGINTGQDAVWADVNLDGKLDLLTGEGNRIRLWMNQTETTGNFLRLNLKPTSGNTKAIGGTVLVEYDGHKKMLDVVCGQGQRMQKTYTLHVGIGNANWADKVTVTWPDQSQDVHTNLNANQAYTFHQGTVIQNQRTNQILSLQPNPSHQSTVVTVQTISAGVKMQVVNTIGQLIEEVELSQAGRHDVELNNPSYRPGIYFIRLDGDQVQLYVL
ncbi:MAG: VCBS repeat-containing protein [Flavobacteriales bacterium]|nr:VCBS repeat-containing protein [Bacteroidota bacterium]MCB9241027.1 VCBS repeat-containing protein [Flavobacteriales bacterium]